MKKLNLNELKVQSFVTDVKNGNHIQTIKGGLSGGACEPVKGYPVDVEWALGTRGGCSVWENMCNGG